MKTSITFDIDTDKLPQYTDSYLVQLWHIAQANPADSKDPSAGELAEHVGREIISRFVMNMRPDLWNHQGRDYYHRTLADNGKWVDGEWVPDDKAGIAADAREQCIAAIEAHIAQGPLQGNGWDEQAQRNGLVLAVNVLRGLDK